MCQPTSWVTKVSNYPVRPRNLSANESKETKGFALLSRHNQIPSPKRWGNIISTSLAWWFTSWQHLCRPLRAYQSCGSYRLAINGIISALFPRPPTSYHWLRWIAHQRFGKTPTKEGPGQTWTFCKAASGGLISTPIPVFIVQHPDTSPKPTTLCRAPIPAYAAVSTSTSST